jgi:hypothetical protein
MSIHGFAQALLVCTLSVIAPLAHTQQARSSEAPHGIVTLGVLENHPAEYTDGTDFRAVRAIFISVGQVWRAFPTETKSNLDLRSLPQSYPKEMTWFIAFDGRSLGIVKARTPEAFHFYSEIGYEQITSSGIVPTVGKKSIEFSGFESTPVYRPLVAVSQPNYSDPDQWKPTTPAADFLTAARRQFRIQFPKETNCRNPEENIPRLWRYQDEDIHVSKAYASNKGWLLIELNLTGSRCDGITYGTGFEGQWYAISPSGTVRFLGTDMWLVDAGDYDNSGQSAILFSIDGYNRGGYRLFYRDFTQKAEFEFSYH